MRATMLCGVLFAATVFAQPEPTEVFTPARFQSGTNPEQPPLASAGGVTTLELEIAASGIVTRATVLERADPFSDTLGEATTLWRFRAAEVDGNPVASKALVVGVFRPPVLLGSGVPDPVTERDPSDEIPYPTATVTPDYPPNALYEGIAVVEVAIDARGDVTEARMLSSEQGFDDAALDAAFGFRFRPARREGRPVESYALLFFGFRQPVTSPRSPRP